MPMVAKSDLSTGNMVHASYLLRSVRDGLMMQLIAIEVQDAELAYNISVTNGAKPSSSPVKLDEGVVLSEIWLYEDVVLRYLNFENTNQSCPQVPYALQT
ncbi:hypothetical protein IFM89_022046 [Coptis chinensis]|uniref:4-hydroxyphenylpyruvate dioxygenase n=1 Tax=Coptis chinensis TaxID=261450 RepID=A0A835M4F9_9MAGN|nr:hypothetical protein IFM89_022046 [Coptis chinensis]